MGDIHYVSPDYLRRAAEQLKALKEASYRFMQIGPGAVVLDAGCGPGIDAVAMAHHVGPDGRVLALDSDRTMLAEAEKQAIAQGVQSRLEFHLASALALPLADASVDACRAERLLQVLPAAAAATVVRELVRVTRPGGWVVLIDTDWCTASVDHEDDELERRLMHYFTHHLRPNGYAGRQLLRLAVEHGLEQVRLEPTTVIQHRLDDTPFGAWLIDSARAASVITAAEAQRWVDGMRANEAAGTLYASVNMLTVAGKKPQ